MSLEGNSATSCGNPFAKLRKNDNGTFDLELRLPAALDGFEARSFRSSGHVIRCIDFTDLSFNHGDAVIEQVLESGRPVTVRFLRDALSWKVMVSVDHVLERKAADFSCGALGIDLNAGHVSAALVDADGNPVETFHIPCVTYGKSSAQAKDSVRKAVAKIVELAQFHGVPIVAERLDFSRKKETLKANGDARYARMLSEFSYSAFGQALDSACLRNGVALCHVNPAYTSIIGRVKFARRYGLSVHDAASVTIARRAMGYSERLPNATEAGTIAVPTNGSVHVTLDLPVRNGLRHVWTEWNKLNKEYHKRALAALRSSGRRSRRPRRCVPASEGRNKHSFHGLVTKVGRSR